MAAAKSERCKFNSNLVVFILLWSLDKFEQPVVPASWRGSFRKDLAAAVRTPLRPFYSFTYFFGRVVSVAHFPRGDGTTSTHLRTHTYLTVKAS